MNNTIMPRSSIWIGSAQRTHEHIAALLHETICGCSQDVCAEKELLFDKQHKQVMYIRPSAETYRMADIDAFLHRISCVGACATYCIIEHADRMPSLCAHAFLTLLEEPPQQYYFLLLGEHKHLFLPTIVSRATVFDSGVDGCCDENYQLFVDEFTQLLMIDREKRITSVEVFEQLLATNKIDISSIKNIIDALIDRMTMYGASPAVLNKLFLLYDKMPMPGGSEAFLRYVYLVI
jgi:hypothetical protein